MLLPCSHDVKTTAQVDPTIGLLRQLDSQHPDVLKAHGIEPGDYHSKLVFRSAVESIRGTYIASSLTQRQGLVAGVLEDMRQNGLIIDYKPQGARQRFDFQVQVTRQPKETAAVEVKGGEGNSINISERPLWATEFLLWCHLDGAIVNQPYHGAEAIIFNRVAAEMVKRQKHVDAVLFKDASCNTALRPCPKYHGEIPPTELGVAPDIFLLPRWVPTEENPHPPMHDINTTLLPAKILVAHGVSPEQFEDHIWSVDISLVRDKKGRMKRAVQVFHKGRLLQSR
jgi:hypothetical protein